MFCGQRKAYLSTDSLLTYSEIAVKDHLGNAFTPTSNGVFRCIGYREGFIDNKETLIWGCYGGETGTEFTNINIWFTDDNGVSLRSIYKFGVSSPVLAVRHVHGIWFNPYDNSFLVSTGDGANECHWMKIVVSNGTSTVTWLATDNGGAGTYRKSVGFQYLDGYIYWGVDTLLSPTYGIWRTPANDLLNTSSYQQLLNTFEAITFSGDGSGTMLATGDGSGSRYVFASCNGVNWKAFPCTGGEELNAAYKAMFNLDRPDARGYYRIDQPALLETFPDFTAGQVLMVRVIKNE